MKKSFISALLLLLASLIWGFAFAFQSIAMEHLGAYTFTYIRFLLGGIVLVPFLFRREKTTPISENGTPTDPLVKEDSEPTDSVGTVTTGRLTLRERLGRNRTLIVGGLICGAFLAIAANLQQLGIANLNGVNVGKAGFLTVLYIVLVPIFGLFLRKKCPVIIWCVLPLALVGLYLLCGGISSDGPAFGAADIYLILCAVFYSFQIIAIDYFVAKVDPVKISCIQFLVCGLLTMIIALCTETTTWQDVWLAMPGILFGGIGSCGIAFTLQSVAQRNLPPAVTSLLMSFESTFSVLGGWLLQGNMLSTAELIGCVCMFVTVITVEAEPLVKERIRRRRETTTQ